MNRENTLFGPRKWSTKCGSQAMNDAPGVMDDVSLNKLPQISFWCMLSEVGFDKSNNELPMHPRCTNPCLWCAGSSPCALLHVSILHFWYRLSDSFHILILWYSDWYHLPSLHLPLVLVGADIFIVGANIFIVRVFNMIKVQANRIDTEAWLVWRGL